MSKSEWMKWGLLGVAAIGLFQCANIMTTGYYIYSDYKLRQLYQPAPSQLSQFGGGWTQPVKPYHE